MPSIAFLTEHHRFPWERQLARADPPSNSLPITYNRIDDDCVLLAVYDDLGDDIKTGLPRERRMVMLSEPPGIKVYRRRYLDQFGIVFGPVDPQLDSVRWITSQPALPWFYGVGFSSGGRCIANLDLATLAAQPPSAKSATISVVISTKRRLAMHRQRLELVAALKEHLGSRLHVFGTEFAPIADKADAIAPHAYHLVLENNAIDHFWTEKTADAFLGWALPVISGCKNLGDYFPAGSFVPIDVTDIGGTADRIRVLLDSNEWEARLPAIRAARERLIAEYELSECLRRVAAGLAQGIERVREPVLLRPNRDLGPAGRLEPLARQFARKLLRR